MHLAAVVRFHHFPCTDIILSIHLGPIASFFAFPRTISHPLHSHLSFMCVSNWISFNCGHELLHRRRCPEAYKHAFQPTRDPSNEEEALICEIYGSTDSCGTGESDEDGYDDVASPEGGSSADLEERSPPSQCANLIDRDLHVEELPCFRCWVRKSGGSLGYRVPPWLLKEVGIGGRIFRAKAGMW